MEEQYEPDSKEGYAEEKEQSEVQQSAVRDPSHITLGGSIVLDGFQNVDGGTRTIVMKMIGQFTKEIQPKCGKFERITVTLSGNDMNVVLIDNSREKIGQASASNVLVAFGNALRNLQSQL